MHDEKRLTTFLPVESVVVGQPGNPQAYAQAHKMVNNTLEP